MGGSKDGEQNGGGANAFNLLMTLLSTEHLQATSATMPDADPEHAEQVRAMKASLREQIGATSGMAEPPAAKPVAPAAAAPKPPTPPASADMAQPGDETKI
jgi:anti-sigma factor RsiW